MTIQSDITFHASNHYNFLHFSTPNASKDNDPGDEYVNATQTKLLPVHSCIPNWSNETLIGGPTGVNSLSRLNSF
jgi:hypothetical protein